jgi:hypothetical protein
MKMPTMGVALLLCATLLTSCTRAVVLQVFNNTGARITVNSYESDLKEKRYVIDDAQSERVQNANRLTINRGNVIWNYNVKPVPTQTYMTSERAGPLVIKLQVESDGTIYVLPPQAQRVMATLPGQPAAYPIRAQVE